MSQRNKDDCKVNNYFYIVINDESKIADLKKYFPLFQPFTENHSIKTFSNLNTTQKENKVIIKEDNEEISNSFNTESDEGKTEKNFENKKNILDQEKEITYIEIPESEPKFLSKKRYFKIESKKKAGRKPKYSTSNGEHTKYSYDNILRKIKVKFLQKLIKYINDKIISKYNGVGKKLIPLKGEISQDNTIKFNIQLMKSKLKDIFSNSEVNGKFRSCEKDYNKNVIDSIYENKIQELIDFLELTFLEVFNIFRDANETKFNGFDNLNTVINELKLKESDNDYLKKFQEVAMDFENYFLQKKARK